MKRLPIIWRNEWKNHVFKSYRILQASQARSSIEGVESGTYGIAINRTYARAFAKQDSMIFPTWRTGNMKPRNRINKNIPMILRCSGITRMHIESEICRGAATAICDYAQVDFDRDPSVLADTDEGYSYRQHKDNASGMKFSKSENIPYTFWTVIAFTMDIADRIIVEEVSFPKIISRK